MIFKENSWKGLGANVLLILAVITTLILIFFYFYLPKTTNHGETITVPNIRGIHIDEIDDYLTDRNLRYEVSLDSGYNSEMEPLSVLRQVPKAGAKVKENRKVYLTLNAVNPPLTKMPKLIDGSYQNAIMVLESYGLELGVTTYKPDLAHNAVLKQKFEGQEIPEGTPIFKGSKIDLVIGEGKGNQVFLVPDLIGRPYDDAEILIESLRLGFGSVITEESDTLAPGTIIRQIPATGEEIRIGEEIDIWMTPIDSTLMQE